MPWKASRKASKPLILKEWRRAQLYANPSPPLTGENAGNLSSEGPACQSSPRIQFLFSSISCNS